MNTAIRCIGGAAIDYKFKAKQSLIRETSNPVSCFTTFGGVARNVAHNLSQWTSHIYLQTVVGDDAAGTEIVNAALAVDINTSGTLHLKTRKTAQYYAALDDDGSLYIAFADMHIFDHIPATIFTKHWQTWQPADIVFIETNLPASILSQALAVAREKKIKLCIDPVSCAKAIRIPDQLEGVFLIKPNALEIATLTNMSLSSRQDYLKACYKLFDRGVCHVIVTLGKDGFLWVNAQEHKYVPALPCNDITDTNGCGDAFIAGLLYGLQRDATILDACGLGQKAALATLKTQHTVAATFTA